MTDATPRLALPLLVPGQAQKEVFHNEALALLDLAVQASVAAVGLDTPPASPAVGSAWIVGSSPVGAWTGHASALAGWTDGGWRFVPPSEGMVAWDQTSGEMARWVDGAWVLGTVSASQVVVGGVQVVGSQRPAIADPAAGAVVDVEGRAAIIAILTALRGHGLVAG